MSSNLTLTDPALNTPMLKQYKSIKANYSDAILFFRLGDFYEMFLDDAVIASKILDLTLTGRGKDDHRIPMCGIPYHAVNNYLPKLVNKGYKVAICEQVEPASVAQGITKREVVRVVTPGTMISSKESHDTDNTYLAAICKVKDSDNIGVSFADISTGEFKICLVPFQELRTILSILNIKELLLDDQLNRLDLKEIKVTKTSQEMLDVTRAESELCHHFKLPSLSAFGISSVSSAYPAAWAVLNYVIKTQQNSVPQLTKCILLNLSETMKIDPVSVQNLDLVCHANTRDKQGSLFWVINHTKTAMGSRLLQSLLKYPSLNLTEINHRLDAVELLKNDLLSREEIRESLRTIYDIERLISRIVTGLNNPKDMMAIKHSIIQAQQLAHILPHLTSSKKLAAISQFIIQMSQESHPFHQIITTVTNAIIDDPPPTIREGHVIKGGYNHDLDQLVHSFSEIKLWINKLESIERERTGIKTLKVGFNKVFGYYFQISNTYRDQVPSDYIRKQTLTNAERYITPELKEKEIILLNGEEKQIALEISIYESVVKVITQNVSALQELAALLAELDCIQTFVFLN